MSPYYYKLEISPIFVTICYAGEKMRAFTISKTCCELIFMVMYCSHINNHKATHEETQWELLLINGAQCLFNHYGGHI